MQKICQILVAGIVLGSAAYTVSAEPEVDKVELKDCPTSVQAAITAAVGKGKLEQILKENGAEKDGEKVYEAEFTVDEVEHSIKVSNAGLVLEEEVEVEARDLPKPVSAAVLAKYPDGTIKEAERVKAGDKEFYEIAVQVGKDEHEFRIDLNGKFLDKQDGKDERRHEEAEGKKH